MAPPGYTIDKNPAGQGNDIPSWDLLPGSRNDARRRNCIVNRRVCQSCGSNKIK